MIHRCLGVVLSKTSTASAALLASSSAAVAQGTDANSKLRIGFIGVGGRCQAHVDNALRIAESDGSVELAAVCDVYNANKNRTAAKIEWKTGKRPTTTGDYRDIISDDSIDAVVIATPRPLARQADD